MVEEARGPSRSTIDYCSSNCNEAATSSCRPFKGPPLHSPLTMPVQHDRGLRRKACHAGGSKTTPSRAQASGMDGRVSKLQLRGPTHTEGAYISESMQELDELQEEHLFSAPRERELAMYYFVVP